MSSFDIGALALCAILAVIGYWRGLFLQGATLISLLVAMILSDWAAPWLTRLAHGNALLSEIQTYYLARILCGMVIYFMLVLLIWYVDQRMQRSGTKGRRLNRWGGAGLGFFKGLVAVAGVCWALSFIPPPLLHSWLPGLEQSFMLRQTRQFNSFSSDVAFVNLRQALALLAQPGGSDKLFAAMQRSGLRADEHLENFKQRHILKLWRDRSVRQWLSNREALGRLFDGAGDSPK